LTKFVTPSFSTRTSTAQQKPNLQWIRRYILFHNKRQHKEVTTLSSMPFANGASRVTAPQKQNPSVTKEDPKGMWFWLLL
jgi:hypothetical protein